VLTKKEGGAHPRFAILRKIRGLLPAEKEKLRTKRSLKVFLFKEKARDIKGKKCTSLHYPFIQRKVGDCKKEKKNQPPDAVPSTLPLQRKGAGLGKEERRGEK